VGTLGVHQGGTVDRIHGEPVGAVRVQLTEEGLADPVLAGMTPEFDAFVGHKEACRVLPPTAVLLATSPACPVQMFRVRQNLYATQFHPELDAEGLCTRIDIYRHAGYFPPESAEDLMESARQFTVTEPMNILKNFVARYAS
jgi:GMP synthase (glutamine-hydrolysing)